MLVVPCDLIDRRITTSTAVPSRRASASVFASCRKPGSDTAIDAFTPTAARALGDQPQDTRRLYREEGLQLRRKTLKRKVSARRREDRVVAAAANDCWSMDFLSDQLFDGRTCTGSINSGPSFRTCPTLLSTGISGA